MVSTNAIFWEVDVQLDFMLPSGKLYVPGAETIITNINLLVDAARQGRVFLISSADAHNPDDAELKEWPEHCIKGTPGADLLREASASPQFVIPNKKGFALPPDWQSYRQIRLEKNTLNVFDNPNTDVLLAKLNSSASSASQQGPKFVIFGVATEYCVNCTADGLLRRGRRVAMVTDALRAIDQDKGKEVLESLRSRGAELITTEEALRLVGSSSLGATSSHR